MSRISKSDCYYATIDIDGFDHSPWHRLFGAGGMYYNEVNDMLAGICRMR